MYLMTLDGSQSLSNNTGLGSGQWSPVLAAPLENPFPYPVRQLTAAVRSSSKGSDSLFCLQRRVHTRAHTHACTHTDTYNFLRSLRRNTQSYMNLNLGRVPFYAGDICLCSPVLYLGSHCFQNHAKTEQTNFPNWKIFSL